MPTEKRINIAIRVMQSSQLATFGLDRATRRLMIRRIGTSINNIMMPIVVPYQDDPSFLRRARRAGVDLLLCFSMTTAF